jgi:glutamate synthase (ferredoxin)
LVQQRIVLELGDAPLDKRITQLCDEAEHAVRDGKTYLVLDDRGVTTPVPGILAAGAIHQRLTVAGLRMQSSIAVADGFARDAHSIATVIAVGANVVTPWLALRYAERHGTRSAFLGTVRSGIIKIMAKLGICSLRSYIGAQTFEALGLGQDIVETCFPGMNAHAPAVGFAALDEDLKAWSHAAATGGELQDRGLFRFRRDGVRHAFDPPLLKVLRAAAMKGDEAAFLELSDRLEERDPINLRDLVEPVALGSPLQLDEVEAAENIYTRFATAAMSLGALAPEVHKTIAVAANRLGARSNSGEGGEDPARYARTADSGRSRIKQVASGRFGVSVTYLHSADEIEIKMAQGSKPGEGGQIPGFKVSAEIAALRGATAGQALISPAPHHDIYSIEDLAELIYDLRRANPKARIAVKLVSQAGIGYVASGVAKANADVIHISGHDGGTGASPLGSIKNSGLPWELGLVEVHHTLLANGLRSRVRLRVDGGFKTGRDVVIATMLGADDCGFGTTLLVALGCIYARQCHKNTCPVGIATQDADLRKKFKGTAEEAETFFHFIAADVRRRLAALGAASLDELRGRSDLLRARHGLSERDHAVDLSEVLRLPERSAMQDNAREDEAHVDDVCGPDEVVRLRPADRAVGARIAYDMVVRRFAGETVGAQTRRYTGNAGQSFGAFITHGLSLELDGDANDYVGKGMEGGSIVLRTPGSPLEPVLGNACFYGARGGSAFANGTAGERLAVRNSGAKVVVEGAGAHCCEYMTAGSVAVLGPVGRNVASGMTGGEAFFLATVDELNERLGPTDLRPHPLDAGAAARLRDLLDAHVAATGSERAAELVATWPEAAARFVRLAPGPVPVASLPEKSEAVSVPSHR